MAESSLKGQKTLWEKKRLLVTNKFSFSHSVFKKLVSQGRQNVSLCGNGLNLMDPYIPICKTKIWIQGYTGHLACRKCIKIVPGLIFYADTSNILVKERIWNAFKFHQNNRYIPTAINNASPKVHDVVFVFLTKGIIWVGTLYGYLQRVLSAISSRAWWTITKTYQLK